MPTMSRDPVFTLRAAVKHWRERASPDRRQVTCIATAEGRRLLEELDPQLDAADTAAM